MKTLDWPSWDKAIGTHRLTLFIIKPECEITPYIYTTIAQRDFYLELFFSGIHRQGGNACTGMK